MSARAQLTVRERLAAGPARGLGAANAIALEAVGSAHVEEELVAALQDDRPVVVTRAANALKKVQMQRRDALDAYGKKILRVALRWEVLFARWNLTIVVGGLKLKGRDKALAVELMFEALRSESLFLRTFAMQGLVDMSAEDEALRKRVRPVVEEFAGSGSAAVRARTRKLLEAVRG